MPEMKVMTGLREEQLPSILPPGMEIKAGDTKIMWDSDNQDEVGTARDTFTKLIKAGYKAFSVKRDGEAGREVKEFDPAAEKLILIPQMRGGA
jgi:hypothetical protein